MSKNPKFEAGDTVTFKTSPASAFGTVKGYNRGKVVVVWHGIMRPGKVGKVSEKELRKI